MKLIKKSFVFVSFFVAASVLDVSISKAAERYESYNGVRGLGMGGAQIAVVNDETALLVNPAGLGKLRDYFITIADPEIGVSSQTQGLVGTDIFAALSPQSTLAVLQGNNGKHLHQSLQVFPSMVFPNFGLGVYANYTTNAEIDAAGTNYKYHYRNDIAGVFGFNFRIWDGRIKLGFNVRAVNRSEIRRDDLSPVATGLTIGNLTSEGFGIGSDAGLILTAPWAGLPTLAVVYRDVGNTRFDVQSGLFNSTSTKPPAEGATLDASIAFFPIVGKRTRTTIAFEYRDALKSVQEDDSSKNLHAGIEFNIADALFLRGGMNQRYWTAGLEVAVGKYQLQFASYGEEIGTATTTREDRRFIGKFAFRF